MITLEKYHGSRSRHTCPACGAKKRFTRYRIEETGDYLADYCGICDRVSSCGYHYTPKEYFAENSGGANVRKMSGFERVSKPGPDRTNGLERDYEARFSTVTPDYIDKAHLLATIGRIDYDRNAFLQFLLELFPNDHGDVWQAVSEYLIGSKDCKTVFWQIDARHRIRTGKIIAYDRATGKRRKDIKPNWVHAELKKGGLLPETFRLEQCFFGEHLLRKYPCRPIAIVEAEKTAVLASICKGVFPDLVWLACGGKSNFKPERLARLGRDRTILIYPDADGFDKWRAIASDARKAGLKVNVSDLIEKRATEAEKTSGSDLADYLIRDQTAINEYNGQAPGDLETIRQERIAIMMYDSKLSEVDATRTKKRKVRSSWN